MSNFSLLYTGGYNAPVNPIQQFPVILIDNGASATLRWAAQDAAYAYSVSAGPNDEPLTPITRNQTATEATVSGLNPANIYAYMVTAEKGGTVVAKSWLSRSFAAPVVTAIAGVGSCELLFEPILGASGYNIYYGLSPGGESPIPLPEVVEVMVTVTRPSPAGQSAIQVPTTQNILVGDSVTDSAGAIPEGATVTNIATNYSVTISVELPSNGTGIEVGDVLTFTNPAVPYALPSAGGFTVYGLSGAGPFYFLVQAIFGDWLGQCSNEMATEATPLFFGFLTTLSPTAGQVQALASEQVGGYAGSYTLTQSGLVQGYPSFGIPAAFGVPHNFIYSGFPYGMRQSEVTIDGVAYNVFIDPFLTFANSMLWTLS